ncbi:MAG TPA: uracil-DNA glycosylase [Tissierellia bacterium]|nr:uracil-DNA glycosylase [Tissierellia bacterium]
MVDLGNSWTERLADEFKKDYYQRLRQALIQEYKTKHIYPSMYDIFNALKYTDYDDVKVVILGQDPYHGPGQAHGLSFSVKQGVRIPPSLQNIYKELQRDLGLRIPDHGELTSWAKQGVLLLNATLTVRQAEPNSHQRLGWEQFTDRVIAELAERPEPMVFLLWGNNAIKKASRIDPTRHLVLKTTHPSPLSASRGFLGCGHFSKTNQFLMEHYGEAIDWQIR